MKLSAQLMFGMAIAFALVCFGVAYDGFTNIDTMADAAAQVGCARLCVVLDIPRHRRGRCPRLASWWMIGHDPEDRER